MSIIVQKYGGSSVATPEKIKEVALRVVNTQEKGHQVVVVVSAMGNTTNQLLSLAHDVSLQPQHRELDMLVTVGERISMSLLSMAIQDLGYPAVSFTGSQSGIMTTNTHSNARIIAVKPYRLQQALALNKIVIVAGFQGVSEHLEITSLGRGGSDTTAVALAAALGAEYAEICSDVDGVYSADPRICEQACKIEQLDYEDMQILADSGAKVLNAEAVEWAKRCGITIHCVATKDAKAEGTQILQASTHYIQPQVSAITSHAGLYYVQGHGSIPHELVLLFEEWGIIDIEVMSSAQGWNAWIPVQNLHQADAFKSSIRRLISCDLNTLYTHVTVVGRSLLANTGKEESIYQKAQSIVSQYHDSMIAHEIKPAYLRWTLPFNQGKSLVKELHRTLVNQ